MSRSAGIATRFESRAQAHAGHPICVMTQTESCSRATKHYRALHIASASEGQPAASRSCCRAGRGTSAAPLPPSRTAISEQPRGKSPVRTQPRQLMSASGGERYSTASAAAALLNLRLSSSQPDWSYQQRGTMQRASVQNPRQTQHVVCMLVADKHSCKPRHLHSSTAHPCCLWTEIMIHRSRLVEQLAAIPAAVTCCWRGGISHRPQRQLWG